MDEKEFSEEEMLELTKYLNYQVIELARAYPEECMIDVAVSCLSCHASRSDETKKEIFERIEYASKGMRERVAQILINKMMGKQDE